MEIFFNLMWVAVTILLCAMWLAGLRRHRAESLLPAIGVQVIALTVLAAILLPVISLTDDLQAATNPAETERVCRRCDQQPSPDRPLHRVPVALAVLDSPRIFPQMPVTRLRAVAEPVSQQTPGFYQAFATRPPPEA